MPGVPDKPSRYWTERLGSQAGGPVDRAIAEVAARQYGVVSLAQLRALGLSGSAVRGRVAAGRLRRLHRTAFAVGHAALRAEGFWIAAVLACGPGALLSHRSAAEHQGLVARRGRSVIDVTVPRTARNRPGVRVHESSTLTERDITVIAGIPCTSAARTLLDLAESADVRTIERALSEAERRRMFDLRAIEDVLGRAVGRRGAPASPPRSSDWTRSRT